MARRVRPSSDHVWWLNEPRAPETMRRLAKCFHTSRGTSERPLENAFNMLPGADDPRNDPNIRTDRYRTTLIFIFLHYKLKVMNTARSMDH